MLGTPYLSSHLLGIGFQLFSGGFASGVEKSLCADPGNFRVGLPLNMLNSVYGAYQDGFVANIC
jgi:hypothetical protein